MSAGAFLQNSIYESNRGTFHAIRVQPETELLTDGTVVNDSAAGPIDSALRAKVSRTSREYGLRPRTITFRFDPGQEPEDHAEGSTVRLPILTPEAFDTYTATPQYPLTYKGGTGVVVGNSGEDFN